MRFQLDEYYEKQGCSWGVVQLRDPIIEKCLEKYDVKALPSCRVVDEFGNCLDANARQHVEIYREKRQMTELFDRWRREQMVQRGVRV
uniref:COX assembly mitochondrial protein n=1 Tax=Caenorhabditis tropicalis TaxID=1561998 RepID=A0A1I7TDU7_9PELO